MTGAGGSSCAASDALPLFRVDNTTPTVLTFRQVGKAYGARPVVGPLSLDISRGSMTAIVGTSGAGKSTLLRLANGLVAPDGGEILFEGVPPGSMERRRIGFVFQSIALFPHMNVARNIEIGVTLKGERPDRALVARMLELVELPAAYTSRMPGELSGGQQQRVGIARALAPSPSLLLLDEPFAALDPVTRSSLARRVRALHDTLGLTSLIVTHDMVEALLIADRVLVMERGQIVADETPRALLGGAGGEQAQSLIAVHRDAARRLIDLQQ
jgi:osmoprotectant transport system ATP-binding protein